VHGVDTKAIALDVDQISEPARVALLGLGQDKLPARLFDALGGLDDGQRRSTRG
jgi:hypothetical protein